MSRKERRARGANRQSDKSQINRPPDKPVGSWGQGGDALQEAEQAYRGMLAADPEQTEALRGLGVHRFRPDAAAEALVRALARNDRAAQLHYYMACAQSVLGRFDLAAAHDQRAIALKPDFIDAYNHLALTFFHGGRMDEALGVLRRAIAVGASVESKRLFVQILRSQRSIPDLDDLRELMARALTEPWCRPSEAAPIAVILIKHHRAIRSLVEHVKACWPARPSVIEWLGAGALADISEQRLLLCLLESAPVCDLDLERLITALRLLLLDRVTDDSAQPTGENILRLACALARQCFLNEYVFIHCGDELTRARRLADGVAAAIKSAAPIPALAVAIAGSYFPLHSIAGAGALSARPWPRMVADLLVQQVEEPRQEQQLRGSIPSLTAIDDPVSLAVQRQYEENPYPRWQGIEPPVSPMSVKQYLRSKFPLAPLQPLGDAGEIEILMAGCGTGQHAIETAQKFPAARILAIDLSASSLAYALRKTREFSLQNITYAQADILALHSIGRRFDLIEASGVLHHLAEPFVGWRALLSLLRPGGVMKIALYSKAARGHVEAARAFIAERGYRPTPDDMRRCRQDLMALDETCRQKPVTRSDDFFTMSECRDLLFHVQEHRVTLPEISAFLIEHDLQFVGFELPPALPARYRSRFRGDAAMIDLASWHIFERENPNAFVGMYQFWIQKRGSVQVPDQRE